MSGAGKSLFTAGLLRVLKRKGLRVAPFKSQNMALNSFVTMDGGEMGRAQAVQALAAGILPDVRMNPILLKPNSDTGSQIIVNGQSIGNMKAADYFAMKKSLVPEILSAYNSLARDYDVICIEGAGSPAEINLKTNDIVNMGMASMVDAPVLLVGDIDRGGVFAQLYGTWALLEADEQKRIKGFIMNKFRGDPALLAPGLLQLEQKCNIKTLGVVPYSQYILPEEDSQSELLSCKRRPQIVDIVVIRLPHMSNYTDFLPLENINGVSLRYVYSTEDLGSPDMVILPGTKNTISDLRWLKSTGLFQEIINHSRQCPLILGVCGGFQMLGKKLTDPEGVEGATGDSETGLGLLDIHTEFGPKKVLTNKTVELSGLSDNLSFLTGATFKGYEIHMGNTTNMNDSFVGCCQGNVIGTYMHGLFDEGDLRNRILKLLFSKKGREDAYRNCNLTSFKDLQEQEFDRLADSIEQSCQMDIIMSIIGC